MKNIIKGIVVLSVLSVLFGSTAFARGYRQYTHWRYHQSTPPPVVPTSTPPVIPTSTPPVILPTPTSTPVIPVSTVQFGAYTNNTQAGTTAFANQLGKPVGYSMVFVNPTDGFPSGFTGNLLIFLEPSVDDDVINLGTIDSYLKTFATSASNYNGQVILALNEEINCDNTDAWGGTYPLNTTAKAIQEFQHIENVIKPIASNIKFAYDVNNGSCYSSASSNSLTAYYPGSSYVDIVGVDGFDFGGQNWGQVFNTALKTLQVFGKPIWILSEGVTNQDNQAQFISDTFSGIKTYNLSGFFYFNANTGGANWLLGSSALSTLKTNL